MSDYIHLFITSGEGPAECRIALSHLIKDIKKNAKAQGNKCQTTYGRIIDHYGPASAIITLEGHNAEQLARSFIGSIRFTFQSPVRPNHKRKNWYVGVSIIEDCNDDDIQDINMGDIHFDTMRAGGPGGQHQNTTDSAVRAVHLPTGLCVISRNERSQHRNKAKAVQRIKYMLDCLKEEKKEDKRHALSLRNKQLERGNEIRHYKL